MSLWTCWFKSSSGHKKKLLLAKLYKIGYKLFYMKKILRLLILPLMFVFFFPISASAETNAGIGPSSFFYFFDTTFEKVGLFFTFDSEKKARKALGYADERLAEAEESANDNKPKAVEKAMEGYKKEISFAIEKSKELKDEKKTEELLNAVSENTARHQEVLAEVLDKVSDEAKEAILKAIEVSKKGQEIALKEIATLKEDVAELKEDIQKLKEELENKNKKTDGIKKENVGKIKKPEPQEVRKEAEEEISQIKIKNKAVLATDRSEDLRKTLLNSTNNNIASFQSLNKSVDEFINIFDTRIRMINGFISDNKSLLSLSSKQALREIILLWNEEYQKDISRSQLFEDTYVEIKNYINKESINPLKITASRVTNKSKISEEDYLAELELLKNYDKKWSETYDSLQEFYDQYKKDIKAFDDNYAIAWDAVNKIVSEPNTYNYNLGSSYDSSYVPSATYYNTVEQEQINVYGGASSYTKIGNTMYGSDGSSYTQIGNTTYGSDGSSYTQIGNTVYGSDGSDYTQIGNTTYGSDGTSYTQIGNTTYGSDGSSATQIGNTTYTQPGY